MKVKISNALREKIGRSRENRSGGTTLVYKKYNVTVNFRTYEDHYYVYDHLSQMLCSFTDSSMAGEYKIEDLIVAKGVTVSFEN